MFILLSTLLGLFLLSLLILGYRFWLRQKKLAEIEEKFSFINTEFAKVIAREHDQNIKMIELKNQIDSNVYKDTLTGLVSRQIFEDRLDQTISQSKRHELLFAILFLNLDGFKIVNEALGLDAGDQLLKEIALRFQHAVRQVDTVSRFAGDEFVFLLPQLTKSETAAFVAQRVLDAISEPFQIKNQEVFVRASIGIALFPEDGEDGKQLLKNADNALHQTQQRGQGGFQFYRKEMHISSQREWLLNSSLHHDEVYQEFVIYYQPEVNVETKKIVSMEALLHWQHPSLGLIHFKEFIQIAENNGTINAMTEWYLNKACQQFQTWKSLGFFAQSLSVNISTKQLENPHFVYQISQILKKYELKPNTLILEISEAMLQSHIGIGVKTLLMLKELGVRISISEFGEGNLALRQLQSIPVDILKVASTLIENIIQSRETEAIIKMIVGLGNTLGVSVIATGITHKNQVDVLKSLGCYLMQGKFFTPPLLPQEFTLLVEKSIVESV